MRLRRRPLVERSLLPECGVAPKRVPVVENEDRPINEKRLDELQHNLCRFIQITVNVHERRSPHIVPRDRLVAAGIGKPTWNGDHL